ncbi:DUF4765 family protein, partial [Escherichia coli]|nr:DUF4765 family protein [Escherichia coli]
VQLEVYNLLSEEKIFEHKIMNNWTRSIKNILTTYLFMSSGAVTARNVQTFSPTINNESRIRLPRALPVGHPYPEEHKASGFSPFMMGGLSGDILPEILTGNGPSIFFNGKHNNQHDGAFGKIIDFTQNGNKISAKDKEIIKRYIFDKINVLIKEYFIRTGKNSHTP